MAAVRTAAVRTSGLNPIPLRQGARGDVVRTDHLRVYDEIRRKWVTPSRPIGKNMHWQETTPIWPSCRPDQVPEELQNAINAVMAGDGVPARVRLRYRDPQTAKWRVFDVVEIDDDDDEGEGFNKRLAAFAVSAAIHLATTKGWEAFEFQVQPTDGVRCEQVLGDHEAKVRALIDAAARKRSPTAARPHADDLEVAIARSERWR